MKILVIFTGGTIGSSTKANSHYVDTDSENNRLLLNMYREQYGDNVEFVELPQAGPYSILSENLNGSYLSRLSGFVKEYMTGDYDGIIVTHGSDSLQYSAAAIKFSCENTPIPIILVCSNYILSHQRANGVLNFAAAVEFIRQHGGNGVFVTYSNSDGEVTVHGADMLVAHEVFSDRLFSVKNNYYGTFIVQDKKFLFQKNQNYNPLSQFLEALKNKAGREFTGKFTDNKVQFITVYPGINWENVLSENCRAVVIQGYHSGTLPTDNEDFKRFAKTADLKKIRIYLCGSSISSVYNSTCVFDKLNITVVEELAPIATYVYVWGVT